MAHSLRPEPESPTQATARGPAIMLRLQSPTQLRDHQLSCSLFTLLGIWAILRTRRYTVTQSLPNGSLSDMTTMRVQRCSLEATRLSRVSLPRELSFQAVRYNVRWDNPEVMINFQNHLRA
jgi:hypothetical protein